MKDTLTDYLKLFLLWIFLIAAIDHAFGGHLMDRLMKSDKGIPIEKTYMIAVS
ncbi:hypothetical protein PM10SUCC1_17510 [Propionigenium maris DSM 9537]|uniref:Uncharacterized protein n=1 Tax=Propionigenium maris DSM 9537 TaxID=1123000 RepID=A0A9W6LN33_9FUSO|nr:hypothetical protein [Propionigenium maris]GLI56237.1 hypothetical protein PM10SUCC1_17510 [Propionigenium maris DSM 9537]